LTITGIWLAANLKDSAEGQEYNNIILPRLERTSRIRWSN